MSSLKSQNEGLTAPEMLTALLTALPDDLPAELRGVIAEMGLGEDGVLPPRLFHEAVAQMSVAISITDINADILYVNRAFEELTGYSAAEVVGRNESLLSNRRTPKAVYVGLWTTIASGNVWTGRLINRKRDGSRYLADLTIHPVKTRDGQVSYYLAMHRDITRMHHLQREVENQKNLIESLVDSAPVVLALVDLDGRTLIENRAYRALAADLGGAVPVDMFLEALKPVLGDDLESACLEEHQVAGFEVRLTGDAHRGPRWFACSGRWVREFETTADSYFETRRQDALLLVCNEITGLKRQYEQARINEVHARTAELEMSRRTREIIEAALYQMQGPLNVMQAFADMARRQEGTNHPLGAAVEEAIASGRTAAASLRHALPDRQQPTCAPININEVIRDVLIVSADRLSAAGIVVDWQPVRDLPPAFGTVATLHVLLRNLLDNAITAVGEPRAVGREVHIETRLGPDLFVEVCICDSGPGIDRAQHAKVFEPFYSNWQRRKGSSGMGLVVVKQIVDELRGDIRIDAHRAHGAAICVMLPTSWN